VIKDYRSQFLAILSFAVLFAFLGNNVAKADENVCKIDDTEVLDVLSDENSSENYSDIDFNLFGSASSSWFSQTNQLLSNVIFSSYEQNFSFSCLPLYLAFQKIIV